MIEEEAGGEAVVEADFEGPVELADGEGFGDGFASGGSGVGDGGGELAAHAGAIAGEGLEVDGADVQGRERVEGGAGERGVVSVARRGVFVNVHDGGVGVDVEVYAAGRVEGGGEEAEGVGAARGDEGREAREAGGDGGVERASPGVGRARRGRLSGRGGRSGGGQGQGDLLRDYASGVWKRANARRGEGGKPAVGFEPTTYALQKRCSTN